MPAAAKYALTYLFVQAEFGLCCPLSMTDSLSRMLRKFGDAAPVERCLPALTTQLFDELQPGAMLVTQQGAVRHPCEGGKHGMAAFAVAGRWPRAYFAPCTHTQEAHA